MGPCGRFIRRTTFQSLDRLDRTQIDKTPDLPTCAPVEPRLRALDIDGVKLRHISARGLRDMLLDLQVDDRIDWGCFPALAEDIGPDFRLPTGGKRRIPLAA